MRQLLEVISDLEPAFFVGFLLAAVALWRAREGYSAWFALLPGILAHELAHYLVALLTGSNPRPLSIALRRTERGWALGSAEFEPGLISSGLVALAPLYLLPLVSLGVMLSSQGASVPRALLAGYVAATLLYAAVPSRADWRIAIRYPVGTLLTLAIVGLSVAADLPEEG